MKHMPISPSQLEAWSKAYQVDNERQLATMSLSRNKLSEVANRTVGEMKMRHKFSLEIKTLPVTNQKHSGRCWLFAATNVLRERIAKDLDLENFELSQTYLAFWDKFERCNYFLTAMLDTASLPTDDRTVSFILQTGVHDGGQWDMCANIIEKYGVVPKDVYDETYQSENTADMNRLLNRNLKICACKLRQMVKDGVDEPIIYRRKSEMLGKIYGFLCSCYGEPPRSFDFEYVDKKGLYHVERKLTPMDFAEKYALPVIRSTVSIIHAPTDDKPFHQTYTIRFLGNVVGGKPVTHLNLTMDEFKAAILRQLRDGKVVWFGSDVGHYGNRDKGIWDDQSYGDELLSGLDLQMAKEDALNYGLSAMNHAMVLTGVSLDGEGKPVRWKIENSWGDEHGKKGYYICSDSWFDEYVFQAAVESQYLGEVEQFASLPPKELAPWDPMGTLAD